MDRASPLRTTHLRDPYGPPILFGSESFMDEVASATNTDPVEFRLQYLKNPRDRDAVRTAAEHYGWDKRTSPRQGRGDEVAIGRGIAFRRHFDTFIALIAEVRVHRLSGKIEVARYVCAHDVGMIVNPETLRHVIDRQLVYGTSRAMFEEVRFDQNMVTSVDWLTYPVVKMDGVPQSIEIVLIEQPDGTLLRLTHSGLPNAEQCARHAEGWAHYLGRLAEVAAGRDPGPDPRHGRTGRE